MCSFTHIITNYTYMCMYFLCVYNSGVTTFSRSTLSLKTFRIMPNVTAFNMDSAPRQNSQYTYYKAFCLCHTDEYQNK
jgi:hypothetical protein